MATVRTAMVQMDVVHGDTERNLAVALANLEKCADRGAEIVALPEMWLTGYAFRDLVNLAATAVPGAIEQLREAARRFKLTIVAGSMPELAPEKVYNTAYVIDPAGQVLDTYRKIHLFSYSGEERFIAGGDRLPPMLTTGDTKYGVTICYDIRFPEVFRPLAVQGAQIIFVPAQLPHPRLNHWRILLQARAVENQTFIVGCNRVGRVKQLEYFGHSMVVDPWGEILAEGGEDEAILVADLDLSQVEATREKMTVFADRAPAIYRTFAE